MSQRREVVRNFGDEGDEPLAPTLAQAAADGYGFNLVKQQPKADVIRKNSDGSLKVGKFTLSGIGMQVDGEITLSEWQDAGKFIGRVGGAWQFWVGDWINASNAAWGETYNLASEITGMKPEVLMNIASVCSKVHFSFRNENLTFTHHVAVSALPPEQQKEWLDRAEKESLSVSKMRRLMKPKPVKSDPIPLLNRKHKATFNRLWKGVISGNAEKVSRQDIATVRAWLDAVESALDS